MYVSICSQRLSKAKNNCRSSNTPQEIQEPQENTDNKKGELSAFCAVSATAQNKEMKKCEPKKKIIIILILIQNEKRRKYLEYVFT